MMGWLFVWVFNGPQWFARDMLLASTLIYGGGDLPPSPDSYGIASRFGDPGDKWIGGTLACKPDERVSTTAHQCAHRSYPCGTILIIENKRNGKRSWCEVADRGPYGANVYVRNEDREDPVYTSSGRKAWYVKKRKKHKPPIRLCPSGDCVGRWRGILDMSPAVSDDLEHNGFERVNVYTAKGAMRYAEYVDRKRSLPFM